MSSHGSFGKPHENWIPWLENELDKLNVEYLTPTFPTPEHQNYSDWTSILDMYREWGCFDNDSIFIGHSCGAAFLAKYIVTHNFKCRAFISAAGYNNFINNDEVMDKLNQSFYMGDDEIANLRKLANKRIAIHTDNDPFIPQEKLHEFAILIDAKEVIVPNGGHLNSSAGFTEFLILLEEIKALI